MFSHIISSNKTAEVQEDFSQGIMGLSELGHPGDMTGSVAGLSHRLQSALHKGAPCW